MGGNGNYNEKRVWRGGRCGECVDCQNKAWCKIGKVRGRVGSIGVGNSRGFDH